jgi:hypothetical protein
MTVEELLETAETFELGKKELAELQASLDRAEAKFAEEAKLKCVDNEFLSRSYSF